MHGFFVVCEGFWSLKLWRCAQEQPSEGSWYHSVSYLHIKTVYAKVTGPSVFAGKFLVGLVNIFQKQDRPSGKKNPKVCYQKVILIKFSLKNYHMQVVFATKYIKHHPWSVGFLCWWVQHFTNPCWTQYYLATGVVGEGRWRLRQVVNHVTKFVGLLKWYKVR